MSCKGLSAGTGKLCIFCHLGLVFIWSCFVSCLFLLLSYVICAPVLTGTKCQKWSSCFDSRKDRMQITLGSRGYFFLIDADGSRRSRVNEEKNNLWSQEYATSFPCEESVQNLNYITDWILPCPQGINNYNNGPDWLHRTT